MAYSVEVIRETNCSCPLTAPLDVKIPGLPKNPRSTDPLHPVTGDHSSTTRSGTPFFSGLVRNSSRRFFAGHRRS